MGKVIEHNIETGEITEREQTLQEKQQAEIDTAAAIVKTEVKLELKLKREALLDKLGITEEEAKLLLGGN